MLFEGTILGDAEMLQCIGSSSHPFAGRVLTYLYMLITILLLLNMSIDAAAQTLNHKLGADTAV